MDEYHRDQPDAVGRLSPVRLTTSNGTSGTLYAPGFTEPIAVGDHLTFKVRLAPGATPGGARINYRTTGPGTDGSYAAYSTDLSASPPVWTTQSGTTLVSSVKNADSTSDAVFNTTVQNANLQIGVSTQTDSAGLQVDIWGLQVVRGDTDPGDWRPVTTTTVGDGAPASAPANPFVIDVHDYGAKGDGVAGGNGTVAAGVLSDPGYTFTSADVGKTLWIDATQYTVSAISNGGAVLSPGRADTTQTREWLLGTDDTAAIQSALDAAGALAKGQTTSESTAVSGQATAIPQGGVVELRGGHTYVVGNSQASFNSGHTACLVVSRRTTLRGPGAAHQGALLAVKPQTYGHVIANKGDGTSYSDFITIADLMIHGFKDWSPNQNDGVHLYPAFDEFQAVDPFNRVSNVMVTSVAGNGFFFRSRGELLVHGCTATTCGQNGFFVQAQSDYRVLSCSAGGNAWSGFHVDSSGAGHFVECKAYFNGAAGGTDVFKSANFALTADQMRNGMTWFTSCEAQESRGSSWVVQSGLNVFTGCLALDPGRARAELTGNGTGLPAVIAGWHLYGGECRQNTFNGCVAQPSLGLWNGTQNWGYAGDAVHVDGASSGYGPQKNRGDVYTFVPTTNSDGTTDPGTVYPTGSGPVGGPGHGNGLNPLLRVDGTPV